MKNWRKFRGLWAKLEYQGGILQANVLW
jgi:hypothetical protein